MVYLAPDTNVLLHYKLFTEVDWLALAEASDVTLLFSSTVIHELDARKYGGSDQRLQARAQTVLRNIELTEASGLATAPAHVAIARTVPRAQLEKLQLDPASADDRILGELITFQRAHGADVRFVTADYGARIKAKAHGLTCIAPPPDLRLNDPDPRAQELRELRERVAQYEAARPTLRPFLAVGDRRDSFQEFQYQAAPPSAETIERRIKRFIERYHYTPRQGDGIELDTWAEYDRSWADYLQQARQYVATHWKYKNRTFFLQFGAENTSNLCANDIRLRLHLPDGFVVDDAELYESPKFRRPPKRPQTANEILFQTLANIGSLNLGLTFPSYVKSFPEPRFLAPRIQKSNSYNIEFTRIRIPQGDAVLWDPIVLIYDDTVEPTPFTIDYWLTIGNGFGVAQGTLHVVFKKCLP